MFFTPLNSFGDNLDEEEPSDDLSKARTPSTGSIQPEHKTKDCSSGKPDPMP